MRFRETLAVSFDYPENTGGISIAPMLLIPFVENSFKHGEIVNGKLKIEITLKVEKGLLHFTIGNSVKNAEEKGSGNGIGLENLKKRLLLLYSNDHRFSIQRKSNWFEASLSLTYAKRNQHV